MFENASQAKLLPTKSFFQAPDWAKSANIKTAPLGPSGPVAPEDLVDAAGRCAAETARAQAPAEATPAAAAAAEAPEAPAAKAAPAANPAYGSVAGDLASAPMPQGPPPAPKPVAKPVSAKPSDRLEIQPQMTAPVIGGIALGMTECQAVRRAGQPGNITVGAGDKGARKVVLTYLSGPWPGIYTFDSGRLKEIAAAPVPEKPAKSAPKKKLKTKVTPKTATTERVYVQ